MAEKNELAKRFLDSVAVSFQRMLEVRDPEIREKLKVQIEIIAESVSRSERDAAVDEILNIIRYDKIFIDNKDELILKAPNTQELLQPAAKKALREYSDSQPRFVLGQHFTSQREILN